MEKTFYLEDGVTLLEILVDNKCPILLIKLLVLTLVIVKTCLIKLFNNVLVVVEVKDINLFKTLTSTLALVNVKDKFFNIPLITLTLLLVLLTITFGNAFTI